MLNTTNSLLTILLLTSCVEYRLSRPDGDIYLGTGINYKDRLDPKLGTNAKLWLSPPESPARLYYGVDVRNRKNVTGTFGMVYYISPRSSLEFGYRHSLVDPGVIQRYDQSMKPRDLNGWNDDTDMFFIGGVVRF